MTQIALSTLIAFALFSMGIIAGILGTMNYIENTKSKSGRQMLYVCWCVFFWNFGYAWMSMCFDSYLAYVARAIALLAVALYTLFVIRYVSFVTSFPINTIKIPIAIIFVCSIVAWAKVSSKDAVDFTVTPWGTGIIAKCPGEEFSSLYPY